MGKYHDDAKCGSCQGPLDSHRDAVCEKCVPQEQYFGELKRMQESRDFATIEMDKALEEKNALLARVRELEGERDSANEQLETAKDSAQLLGSDVATLRARVKELKGMYDGRLSEFIAEQNGRFSLEARVKELGGKLDREIDSGESYRIECIDLKNRAKELEGELAKASGEFCEACTCESCMAIQESRDAVT